MKKIKLHNIWTKYHESKKWWSIALDFTFLLLIIAMLIPNSRKALSAFAVQHTLLSPRESSKTVLLDEKDFEFTVIGYNGEPVKLSQLRDKPIFLNFWATWCPPCIAELPSIQKLYEKYKNNVHFIFISNEPPVDVAEFITRKNYSLPLYFLGGTVPGVFETSTIPTTFIVNKRGRLILYKTGAARWDSKKMFRLMDRLINEK